MKILKVYLPGKSDCGMHGKPLRRIIISLGPSGSTRAKCVVYTVPFCEGEHNGLASADGGRAAGGAVALACGA